MASTGGQLMPPVMGAVAFIMAEFLNVSYTDIVLAALVPAILYYMALFIQADLEAARERHRAGAARTDSEGGPGDPQRLGFVLPFFVLIYGMFQLNLLAGGGRALFGCDPARRRALSRLSRQADVRPRHFRGGRAHRRRWCSISS